MNKIKFRGFREAESGSEKIFVGGQWIKGEWVYGLPSYDAKGNVTELETYEEYENGFAHAYYEVIPETVGQYTGMKGRGQKEIYAGDVLVHVGFGECAEQSRPYGTEHRSFKNEKVYVKAAECGFIARHVSNFGKEHEDCPSAVIDGWEIIRNYDLWNLQRWYVVVGNIFSMGEYNNKKFL